MRVTAPRELRTPEDLAFLRTAHLAEGALEIDLTDVEWISPLGVVAVLATCLRAEGATVESKVYLPDRREPRTYLAAIGLIEEVERHGWALQRDIPEEQAAVQAPGAGWTQSLDLDIDPNLTFAPFLPVSRLTTMREVDTAADKLEDALNAAPHLRGGLFDELLTIAVELTANAREHGSDCYAVAQPHSGRTSGTPGVHIAVADFGPGLEETLRDHYPGMSDVQAIVHAFTEQVSGTGKSERGFGLTQIAEIVDRDPRNELHVISHSGHVVRSAGTFTRLESQDLFFRGTLASAYLFSSPI